MRTTIKHQALWENNLKTSIALINKGKSKITINKIKHAIETVTVRYELTKYLLTKYQGDEEKALQSILEGLTAKDLKRLLFDELDAQSVQPTTLKFKTLVYKVYTQKKKETK
jgi:hypothetical protein